MGSNPTGGFSCLSHGFAQVDIIAAVDHAQSAVAAQSALGGKGAVRSITRPLPLLCFRPAFWPPSRSNTQDGNGRAVRKQTSAQLLVFSSLSLRSALSQATAAHNGGGGKARRRAQRYGKKLKVNSADMQYRMILDVQIITSLFSLAGRAPAQ